MSEEELYKAMEVINRAVAHSSFPKGGIFEPVHDFLYWLDSQKEYYTKYRALKIYFPRHALTRNEMQFLRRLASIGFNKYKRTKKYVIFEIFSERGYKRGEQAFVSITEHYLGAKPDYYFGSKRESDSYFPRLLEKSIGWVLWLELLKKGDVFLEILRALREEYGVDYCVSATSIELKLGRFYYIMCEAEKELEVEIIEEKRS